MRSWLLCSAVVVALAGCGDEPTRSVAEPSPTPPDSAQLKFDLLAALTLNPS